MNGNKDRTSSFYFLSWILLRFFLPAFGHVFRPRLPTCHSNRGTFFSSILGSWVGAQRPRTRGKSFSGFGSDDCESLTTVFFLGQLHQSATLLCSLAVQSFRYERHRNLLASCVFGPSIAHFRPVPEYSDAICDRRLRLQERAAAIAKFSVKTALSLLGGLQGQRKRKKVRVRAFLPHLAETAALLPWQGFPRDAVFNLACVSL